MLLHSLSVVDMGPVSRLLITLSIIIHIIHTTPWVYCTDRVAITTRELVKKLFNQKYLIHTKYHHRHNSMGVHTGVAITTRESVKILFYQKYFFESILNGWDNCQIYFPLSIICQCQPHIADNYRVPSQIRFLRLLCVWFQLF